MSFEWKSDFLANVAMNEVPGFRIVNKFGQNPSISSDGDEDIWTAGGNYIYATSGAVLYAQGTTATTDVEEITVQGLDSDFGEVESTVNLNGTTAVKLVDSNGDDILFYRVFRSWNNGSLDLTQDYYIHSSDATLDTDFIPSSTDLWAVVEASHQQTLMALYTIPVNNEGYVYRRYSAFSATAAPPAANVAVSIHHDERKDGKVFRTKETQSILSDATSALQSDGHLRPGIPAGTDIKLHVHTASATIAIDGGFDLLLRDLTVT